MKQKPFTGSEYLKSLQDNREVYFQGKKITDVTDHPATKNAAHSVARLYDALHAPEHKSILCCETEDGSGYTHRSFRLATNSLELKAQRDAMALWARLSFGQLSRTPDYKSAFSCALGADPEFFGKYAENARNWYKRIQRTCLYLNHALIHPPGESEKTHLRVIKENEKGVYVTGAKAVATNAALTNYIFVGQVAGSTEEMTEENSSSFIVPTNAEGLKIILRQSYEFAAHATGKPDDYPFSSHFDENDAILIFENVFVPWENVLIHKDLEKAKAWFDQGFGMLFPFQAATRMAVKMDFLAGLHSRALEVTGSIKHRSVRVKLGEVIAWRNLLWSLTDAMWANPSPWKNNFLLPNSQAIQSFRVFAPEVHRSVKNLIEESVASALIYLPSGNADASLSEYFGGADGTDYQERIRLMKLLWDMIGSEFAGRQELYEMNNAGGPEATRLQCLKNAQRNGDLGKMQDYVRLKG